MTLYPSPDLQRCHNAQSPPTQQVLLACCCTALLTYTVYRGPRVAAKALHDIALVLRSLTIANYGRTLCYKRPTRLLGSQPPSYRTVSSVMSYAHQLGHKSCPRHARVPNPESSPPGSPNFTSTAMHCACHCTRFPVYAASSSLLRTLHAGIRRDSNVDASQSRVGRFSHAF